jgi:hypothetical protein
MDVYQLLLIVAVVVFAIAAWLSKSLECVGPALFAGAFLSKTL